MRHELRSFHQSRCRMRVEGGGICEPLHGGCRVADPRYRTVCAQDERERRPRLPGHVKSVYPRRKVECSTSVGIDHSGIDEIASLVVTDVKLHLKCSAPFLGLK